MKTKDLILTASANLKRSKSRTLLTILAIIIGSTTLTLTNGIGYGLKTYINRQVGNLGTINSFTVQPNSPDTNLKSINSPPSKYNPSEDKVAVSGRAGGATTEVVITQTGISKIAAVRGIISVTPDLALAPDYIASVANPNNKFQLAISQLPGSPKLDMLAGSPINNQSSNYELTIPSSYVTSLGFSSDTAAINKQVSIGISDANGDQSIVTATIVGVQNTSLVGSVSAYANENLAVALYNIQTHGLPEKAQVEYTSVTALFSPNLTIAQINNLKTALNNVGYSAQTIKDQENIVFTAISALTDILDVFGVIVLLAAAIGIVNTLFMAVQERTKEIGLMKALGMSRARIFALFSIEASLIGFWGSFLGVLFADLIGHLLDKVASKGFLKDFTGLQLLTFPLRPLVTIVIGIMLIAFLAGTLPARRASLKDPIDALRYE